MNTKDIERLIALIENTDISEIEFQTKDDKIRISRNTTQVSSTHTVPFNVLQTPTMAPIHGMTMSQPMASGAQSQAVDNTLSAHKPVQAQAEDKNLVKITSPFVGTFYRAPAPGADPFVEKGVKVKKGETLCIVEAMKLMNEIEAECNGIIKEILIENAQPVEYGEVLFLIERTD